MRGRWTLEQNECYISCKHFLLVIRFRTMINDVLWDFQLVHLFSHYSGNPRGRYHNKLYISWLVFQACDNTIKQHFKLYLKHTWCDYPLTIFEVLSIRLTDRKMTMDSALVETSIAIKSFHLKYRAGVRYKYNKKNKIWGQSPSKGNLLYQQIKVWVFNFGRMFSCNLNKAKKQLKNFTKRLLFGSWQGRTVIGVLTVFRNKRLQLLRTEWETP